MLELPIDVLHMCLSTPCECLCTSTAFVACLVTKVLLSTLSFDTCLQLSTQQSVAAVVSIHLYGSNVSANAASKVSHVCLAMQGISPSPQQTVCVVTSTSAGWMLNQPSW